MASSASMMSFSGQQQQHHSGDSTPNWSKINCALNLLFREQQLANLKQPIGSSQRLDYEQFEIIFYHLFAKLDAAETKRRFRSLYPARNKEKQTEFINAAMRFINDKQLTPQRLRSVSQLKTFGGEPFRRLLSTLIMAAQQREINSIRRQLASRGHRDHDEAISSNDDGPKPIDLDESNRNYLAELVYQQQQARVALEKLKQRVVKYKELRSRLVEARQLQADKWKQLAANFENVGPSYSSRGIKLMCSQLFSRLEKANEKIKLSSDKIKAIKLPAHERPASDLLAAGSLFVREPKRVSQYIREMKVRLKPETDNEPPPPKGVGQSSESILRTLSEYDQKMAKLIQALQEAADRADEKFLQDPDNLDKFKLMEKMFPLIDLNHQLVQDGDCAKPSAKDIEKILAKYPDSRYDDREVMESLRKCLG